MPRRPALTTGGRRRIRLINDRNRNVSNEDEGILIDSYRCALNVIPRNFESFSLGDMDLRCLLCGAKHFKSEVTLSQNNIFTLCCHEGKVALPPLTENPFFKNLYNGLFSPDPLIKQCSQNY